MKAVETSREDLPNDIEVSIKTRRKQFMLQINRRHNEIQYN